MKKTLSAIGLMIAAMCAQAGPVEELLTAYAAAAEKAADRVEPQGTTSTVIRGYFPTRSGLNVVTSATQTVGFLATKSVAHQAAIQAGYTFEMTQNKADIYRQTTLTPNTLGIVLIIYYDAAGNASEVYLFTDGSPV